LGNSIELITEIIRVNSHQNMSGELPWNLADVIFRKKNTKTKEYLFAGAGTIKM